MFKNLRVLHNPYCFLKVRHKVNGSRGLFEFICYYCCPIKIGIDYYSFENTCKEADLILISKVTPPM